MTQELNIKLNIANEYEIDASGKDLVSLDVASEDIKYKAVIDGKLTIELKDSRVIKLSNWELIDSIKTIDGVNSFVLTRAKDEITWQSSPYYYSGTGLDDVVNAETATPVMVPIYGWWNRIVGYTPTETGVTINSGAGNDIITGSAYNDTIIGGTGQNTILIDTVNYFGADVVELTDGEKLYLKFKDINADERNIKTEIVDKNAEFSDLFGIRCIMRTIHKR